MKKTLLSLALGFLVVGGTQVSAQSYIDENFNSGTGLPSGWTSSVNTRAWSVGAPNNVALGISSALKININAPGKERVAGINGNVESNNGAILSSPAFSIPASVNNAYVTFDYSYFVAALNSDKSKKETLELVYSTDGSNWTTIEEIPAVSRYIWNNRGISLANLAGKNNVKIGFRYSNSSAKLAGAAIDNIRVHVPGESEMGITFITSPVKGAANAYVGLNSNVSIKGVVQNNGTKAISSYKVFVQKGNGTPESTTVSANIPSFAMAEISGVSYKVDAPGEHNLKVWVELSGDNYSANDSGEAFVEAVSFQPVKRLVFEEGTGTWCPWCTRGSFKMKEFYENYTGMAAQVAVHNGDPMVVAAYDSYMRFSAYPKMKIDRVGEEDPGNITAIYLANKDNFGFADITMGNVSVSNNKATVPVTIKPAVSIEGGKLAVVVTEDNVTGTGAGWGQKNAYAGGGKGPMGGYENKPSTINDEVYEFVARAIAPTPGGAPSGLPNKMEPGKTYTAELTVNLDASWKKEDIRYIVMLIGSNGQVLNSDFTGSKIKADIKHVVTMFNEVSVYPNPVMGDHTYMEVTSKDAISGNVTITDALGRTVQTMSSVNLVKGNNKISINTSSLANGVYFVNLNTEKGQASAKLQVIR